MTATRVAVEAYYASGHCAVGSHDRCRGLYAGVACQCACGHRPPEPPDVDLLPELDVMEELLEKPSPVRHCPTCTCEDPS